MVSINKSRGDRSLRALVDPDSGIISRQAYVDEAIYQQELEQIFARAWLFIGHESQVPNPGDFVVSRMGAEEVILVRDRRDKRLHVFLNSCRHKGMKVCRYDDGNTLVFTWEDGRPMLPDSVTDAFKRIARRLGLGWHPATRPAAQSRDPDAGARHPPEGGERAAGPL